jgi:prepilin-type N-terminal cleavage/methylation domain-containing protein
MVQVDHHRRAGMTLVELLVVVAILSLLAITVLPTLSTSADARRTRETARDVSSYIAKAQSRAIGRPEWAGFWMTTPISNPTANFSMDFYLADVPTVFRGNSIPTLVLGTRSGSAFLVSGSNLGTVSGTAGDLVRFDGQPPWYAFQTSATNQFTIGLRNGIRYVNGITPENVNQTALNTPWPAEAGTHTFEILRQPIRAGSPLTLADGRCIDLSWSGYGGSSLATYSTWSGLGDTRLAESCPLASPQSPPQSPPQSIAVLFDGTGCLRQLFYNGHRVSITGPVFLLVGRTDRAGNNFASRSAADDSLGANWQYSDSFWIAIDPLSGVAKTAECAANATNVFDSQSFIRSEIVAGGR